MPSAAGYRSGRLKRKLIDVFQTNDLEEHVALIKRQVDRSLDDPEVRQLAVKITSGKPDRWFNAGGGKRYPIVEAWGEGFVLPGAGKAPCRMRDDWCEVVQVWNFVVANVRYVFDPSTYDLFCTAEYTLRAGGGDCFPTGTLLLRDDFSLTPIDTLRPGDRIWGQDAWSTVEAVAPKGALPITAIRLNNGSWLRLTEEHKVYVAVCDRHARRTDASAPCSCPLSACRVERVRVADLHDGMRLVQPERIAFGADAVDPDQHYLDGLYLADGWSEPYRFAISGRDGHPKEAQKHEVAAICERLGLSTRWNEKYISINDSALAQRMASMGGHAPEKRALSLDLGEAQAAALLRGIMADSGANTYGAGRTLTTTSRMLAVQARVLQRMFGRSTSWAYIEDHGGLGSHPVYRVNVRAPSERADKILRIKQIVRGLPAQRVLDLQTSDHKVYLPEHDVVVSNCDDMTILQAALLKALGFEGVAARVVSTTGQKWEHVYALVGLAKDPPREWYALDPTVEGVYPGWQYNRIVEYRDFYL